MSQPYPSAVLDQARAVKDSYNPNLAWTFQVSQDFGIASLSGAAQVEWVTAEHFSALGIDLGSTMPISLSQAAAQIVSQAESQGYGRVKVAYIEAWAQDGRVLGTGYVTWFYIAVYATGG